MTTNIFDNSFAITRKIFKGASTGGVGKRGNEERFHQNPKYVNKNGGNEALS